VSQFELWGNRCYRKRRFQGLIGNLIVFSGVEFNMNFARVATGVFASLLAIAAPAYLPAQYMRSIQQRWDASDLVCVGHAASPARTGRVQQIDGSDRDELATQVIIERCLKGRLSANAEIRVLGFDVVALKNISGGYGYSGPPTGFVSAGRNLLFLKPTKDPDQYEVTVPVFATAIHLADTEPDLLSGEGSQAVRAIVVRELEGALIQFEPNDLSYIDYLMGYLGAQEGIAECLRLSSRVSVPLQQDLAVAMLLKGQSSLEPVVISLLLDTSAPLWKRQNAAGALGEHGTGAALIPLQEIASHPGPADGQESLQLWAAESLSKVKVRLVQP
jgi:hypothetical protein